MREFAYSLQHATRTRRSFASSTGNSHVTSYHFARSASQPEAGLITGTSNSITQSGSYPNQTTSTARVDNAAGKLDQAHAVNRLDLMDVGSRYNLKVAGPGKCQPQRNFRP